ncbi:MULTISPECIES: YdiK family protein [Bacillaceae]|uniref:YdiK family protein n=1 Tax=Bacillaceae TaxID=186817 RepID=UPI001C57BBF6|nr:MULTISPECIES: YdiK family protein [Rossellomorea]MBW3110707.1 YdiK family protein [Bacillus sp. MCCB 382]MCA1061769.1 YdiK family protein [Rossellomorea aquimaris]MDX8346018.1 YdiK family protein [Rossellomorea sp. YZS02]
MRRSPLFSGVIYLLLGVLFTYFAVQNVQNDEGWGFFTYMLIFLATLDFGSGLRMIMLHFKIKKQIKNKK